MLEPEKVKYLPAPQPQQPKSKTFSGVSASTFHCRYNSWYFCRVFSFQILGSKGKVDFVLNNYFDLSKFKNWVQIFFSSQDFRTSSIREEGSSKAGGCKNEADGKFNYRYRKSLKTFSWENDQKQLSTSLEQLQMLENLSRNDMAVDKTFKSHCFK